MKLFKTVLLAVSLLRRARRMGRPSRHQASPHGGQVHMTDTHHLELVMKDKDMTVYVMNHANTPSPARG